MTVALALAAGLLGAVLFDAHFGGFALGAAFGALLAWVNRLSHRVRALERRLGEAPTPAARPATPSASASTADRRPPAQQAPSVPHETPTPRPAAAANAAPPTRAPGAASTAAATAAGGPRAPGPIEPAFDRIRIWFTTGNVPVKVGVVLSVFGVGFLVKEAVDRHWMIIPIELRLFFVGLFGLALLALGWRVRDSHRNYALSVQGGGVAVLYLTTYASFAVYGLLPAATAFLMLLVVTLAVGALAVLQDARSLAVLGVVGGFMAPVLTSDGSGNHVALFGYYAVLNVAIVGVAWFKSWRVLNVLGFLFTFAVGSLWGYSGYRPEHFATTEPFLVLFVLMYTLIPILFANARAPNLKGFVDGTLLFGTPIVGFGLQTRLVGDTQYGLAISAIALAAFYIGLAAFIHRKRVADLRVLVEALFALSLVFLTIAVPLALDARWTSAAWALQGAAMIWLGVRQRRKLALASGIALQLAAGAVHFTGDYLAFRSIAEDLPVLNGAFLCAALIAAAGGLSGWLTDRRRAAGRPPLALRIVAAGFLTWATAWWLLAGIVELGRHAPGRLEPAVSLLFVAATALAAVLAAPRVDWPRLNAVGLSTLPAIVLGALLGLFAKPHPLAAYGWIAWPAIFAVHAAVLRMREKQFPRLLPALHAIAYWIFALLLAIETAWQIGRFADGIWPVAAALAASAALVLVTVRASAAAAWPIGVHRRTYLLAGAGLVLTVVSFATLNNNLRSPGDPAPLPYVPLLNPLELTSVFVVLVLLGWWRAVRATRAEHGGEGAQAPGGLGREAALAVPSLLGLFLLTMTIARTVHHWAGVPFELTALAASTQFQAALSIAWSTTALAAMLLGARFGKRAVWLAGAALMAVVVAKLFLVDLGNAGTVGRIVSFLGVGILLLVVGYFAPVPPRPKPEAEGASAEAGS